MLELKNVSKIYSTKSGDVHALDNINLYFPETGMVFITGKSGSGKTTLLNCIGGLDDYEGEIIIKGKSTLNFSRSDFDSYRNTYIGFIFQEYNLLDSMTIAKNISLANELQGIKDSENTIKDLLKKVDLEDVENRKPQELSGGQRQRVAIARALVKNPSIIMADEPTGALDTENGLQVIGLLKKLSKEKLVIVVSHDLELANKYADRIINLKDGKIESDITIGVDENNDRNIATKSTSVAIKRGADLTREDLAKIKQAVKHKKDVFVSDNINVVKKETIIENKKVYDDVSPFLKTHMGFWDTIKLGLNTLKTKKIRLIITVILCAIAFSVFGIFDAMAIYDETRLTANTINSSITPSTVITPQILEANGSSPYSINVNDSLLENLSIQTGFNYKGVYNSYYFGTQSPVELSNNSIVCKISKYYYYKKLNGAVEFNQDDLNAYGFNVKYGRLPENYQEIAITEYFANCMVNWYYTYKDNEGNPTYLKDLEVLVNHIQDDTSPIYLTLGTNDSKFAYKIVGIIDVGAINKKFNVLLNDYDEGTPIIQNEYLNYITNSFNLYGFVKPGFSTYSMQQYNTLNKYINKSFAYQFTNKDKTPQFTETYTKTKENFYNFEDLKNFQTFINKDIQDENGKTNLYLFIKNVKSDETSLEDFEEKTSLEGNEVLLDIKQFEEFYGDHLAYLKNVAESTSESTDIKISTLSTYPAEINNQLNIIKGKYTTKEKLEALKDIIFELNAIQTYIDNVYHVQRTNSVLERELVAKKFDTSRYQPGTTNPVEVKIDNNTFKIVGFYTGISNLNANSSIILSTAGMSNLGINTMQGNYSSIIATNTGRGNVNALSKLFLSKVGFSFIPQNNAISMVKLNSDFFSNLSLLFLIVSAVFALFSIAMFSNSISSSIKSKYVEIGILRALGARGSDIFKMFLIEVLAIALINVVCASVVAGVGCIFVNMFLANYLGLYIPLASFGVRQVLVILGLSVAVGIISASIPLISVSKQKPVETIRKAF